MPGTVPGKKFLEKTWMNSIITFLLSTRQEDGWFSIIVCTQLWEQTGHFYANSVEEAIVLGWWVGSLAI